MLESLELHISHPLRPPHTRQILSRLLQTLIPCIICLLKNKRKTPRLRITIHHSHPCKQRKTNERMKPIRTKPPHIVPSSASTNSSSRSTASSPPSRNSCSSSSVPGHLERASGPLCSVPVTCLISKSKSRIYAIQRPTTVPSRSDVGWFSW